MAHIVDKEENLRRFIGAMNDSSSIFTRSKNFGKSSKDVSTSSTPSTALSPAFTPTAMDPNEGHPTSPSSLYAARDAEDDGPNVLSSRDPIQQPNTPPSKSAEPDHFDLWTTPTPSFNIRQNHDDRSTYPDSLVNKLLISPQLAGTRAPPPTPETAPHIATENNEDIEEIVASQVNKHFANKSNAVGLGESIHAPHRSSPLTGGFVRPKSMDDGNGNTLLAIPEVKLSTETRRLRQLSFERASFKAADSPSESISFTKSAETADCTENKLTTSSGTQGASRTSTVSSDTATDWVPPHSRIGGNAPTPVQPSTTEPKPQVKDGNYASSIVKKMEAGTLSFLAKWGAKKEKTLDQTQASWEEPVEPESRDEPVGTPASSAASTTDEETCIVYTPAELIAMKSQSVNEKPAMLVVDPVPTLVHESTKPEEVKEKRPSTVAEIPPTEADLSFLPLHLRIGPSSSNTAPKPKPVSSGGVAKEIPPVTQPPLALPSINASKVPISLALRPTNASNVSIPAKVQDLKTSTLSATIPKPSAAKIENTPPLPPGYSSGAKALTPAANALGKDGELFFESYPKPQSRGRPVARIRKAIISHLPPRCTAKFVASLVYGGPIESIVIKPNSVAEVIFVNAQDCTQFCSDNDDGLEYGKDRDDYVLIDMNTDVDVVGGKLQEMLENGATRCVHVIGVDHEWTKERLWALAEKRNSRLEHLEDKMTDDKIRTVTFRFCKMDDANTFKTMLVRDQDWEHCNIRFEHDPCATAQGVHFND